MILSCSVKSVQRTVSGSVCTLVRRLHFLTYNSFFWVIWYVFLVAVLVIVFDFVIARHDLQFINLHGEVFLSNVGTIVFIGALNCSTIGLGWFGILDVTSFELIVLFFL